MHRSKNQFFKQAVCSIWLIASLQTQADSSLNKSINKHQDTFETAAMKIWDWAEVGYQEYKSSELLKNELQSNGFSIFQEIFLLSPYALVTAASRTPIATGVTS